MFRVTAGPHDIGATFLRESSALLETQRQPYQAHFNFYRHPRIQPAVFSVTILGPVSWSGSGATPSRQKIFTCKPQTPSEGDACAESILGRLATQAYRRPTSEADLEGPMRFYRLATADEGGGFEAGIERALSAILVSPHFLFRVERDPRGIPPNSAYRVGDFELASRLSFFLWSSLPDDELHEAAASGELRTRTGLESHVRRMLADPRSRSLVNNFASQMAASSESRVNPARHAFVPGL